MCVISQSIREHASVALLHCCCLFTKTCGDYTAVAVCAVPIYDSLGDNVVEYICDHAGVELIFLDVAKLPEYTRVGFLGLI